MSLVSREECRFLLPTLRTLVGRTNNNDLQVILGAPAYELVQSLAALSEGTSRPPGITQLREYVWEAFCSELELFNSKGARCQLMEYLLDSERDTLINYFKGSGKFSSEFTLDDLYSEFTPAQLRELAYVLKVDAPERSTSKKPSSEFAKFSYGLRDYQWTVVARALELLKGEIPRFMIHLPTGAGKTRVAMNILCKHLTSQKFEERGAVCWIASRKELIQQASGEFKNAWESLGDEECLTQIISSDVSPPDWEEWTTAAGSSRVLFSTVQSLHKILSHNPERLGAIQTIVFDEAHEVIADTYYSCIKILIALMSVRSGRGELVGLSATPARSDVDGQNELVELFGSTKLNLDGGVQGLVEKGYLSEVEYRQRVYEPSDSELIAKISEAGLCDSKGLELISSDNKRNVFVVSDVKKLIDEGLEKIIVFTPTVENARRLALGAKSIGLEAKSVDSNLSAPDRDAVVEWFKQDTGGAKVLFNCKLLTTGFDCPMIDCCYVARPTNSLVEYSQMIGRAIRGRKSHGTKEAVVLTVVDRGIPGFDSVQGAFESWEEYWNGSASAL